MTREEKSDQLAAVAAEIAGCVSCPLSGGRLKTVPGEGDPNAQIMFIGEAPGWHEDQQGRPFVGAAGQFLEGLLQSIGLRRDQVFISNVVKCRPPDNRDPQPEEIAACNGYLDRQIGIIDPLVIATLGRHSLGKFLPGQRISRVHGQPRQIAGRTIMPMYHPAAALHRASLRREVDADFRKLPEVVAEAQQRAPSRPAPSEEADPPAPPPEQLSLF